MPDNFYDLVGRKGDGLSNGDAYRYHAPRFEFESAGFYSAKRCPPDLMPYATPSWQYGEPASNTCNQEVPGACFEALCGAPAAVGQGEALLARVMRLSVFVRVPSWQYGEPSSNTCIEAICARVYNFRVVYCQHSFLLPFFSSFF